MYEKEFMSAPYYISKARFSINKYLSKRLKDMGFDGIVPSHGDIISSLLHNGPLTMSQLASRIKRDKSTVTTLISKLHKQGYIDIVDNPKDMRSKLVCLTPKGEDLREGFTKVSMQMHDVLWDDVDREDGKVFLKVLKQVIDNFQD